MANYLTKFIHDSRSVGAILLGCTALSLLLTNRFIGADFQHLLHAESPFLQKVLLPHSPTHFINDGLMTLFFFLAGMEIKREILSGELAGFSKALLPAGAALGGMLVPALLFFIVTKGTIYQAGWGIPMATDIAFSLGIASMLGKRFPASLKIFLTALAIIDDLGAILVIAFFYGSSINGYFLAAAALVVGIILLLNFLKIPFGIPQFLLGLILWWLVFNSGIHATIAGVVFAMMVPAQLLQTYEHRLHKLVNFFILPLFALANTAILLPADISGLLFSKLSVGIMTGLFIGKPMGIFIACYIMVRCKLAVLPRGVNWWQIFGVGILAGIGFTMSIFITNLAFSDAILQDVGKVAILLAAILSIVCSFIWMSAGTGKQK